MCKMNREKHSGQVNLPLQKLPERTWSVLGNDPSSCDCRDLGEMRQTRRGDGMDGDKLPKIWWMENNLDSIPSLGRS